MGRADPDAAAGDVVIDRERVWHDGADGPDADRLAGFVVEHRHRLWRAERSVEPLVQNDLALAVDRRIILKPSRRRTNVKLFPTPHRRLLVFHNETSVA